MGQEQSKETNLPLHVAIIMDGNRRWARQRGLPEIEGHREGARKIKPIVEKALEFGVKHLTFWAFSTENWKRSQAFLGAIMTVFREFLLKRDLFEELKSKGGQVHIFGDLLKFPPDIQDKLNERLVNNRPIEKKIDINFALNYGGREEILRAIRNILKEKRQPEEITPELFSSYLYTAGQPNVDFIIRTGGEMRLSGYLPWQAVYAELYFTETFWPDFSPQDLAVALDDFTRRERRFGGDSQSKPRFTDGQAAPKNV